MKINDSLLCKISDPMFAVKAFADFTKSRIDKMTNLLACLDELAGELEVVDVAGMVQWDGVNVDGILQKYGFNRNQYISLAPGKVQLNDILYLLHANTSDELIGDVDANGNLLSYITIYDMSNFNQTQYRLQDVLKDLHDSLHSTVLMYSALLASDEESKASKLSVYRDNISRVFGNAFSDLSGASDYFTGLLETATSGLDFMARIHNDMDIEHLDTDYYAIQKTPMYQYTGVTPVSTLDLTTFGDKVQYALDTGAKIVKSFFKGVTDTVSSVFNKAKKALVNVTTNPYDIAKDYPDNDLNTVDSFAFQYDSTVMSSTPNLLKYDIAKLLPNLYAVDGISAGYSILELVKAGTYKMSTICGETLIFLKEGTITEDQKGLIYCQSQFKPRPIKRWVYDKIISTLYPLNVNYSHQYYTYTTESFEKLKQACDSLRGCTNIYVDVDSEEKELAQGFMYSFILNNFLCSIGADELSDTFVSTYNIYSSDYLLAVFGDFSNATNATFVTLTSGWNPTTQEYTDDINSLLIPNPVYDGVQSPKIKSNMRLQATMLFAIMHAEDYYFKNPLDKPFIPYRYNKEGFSTSQYVIKTDERNIEAFDKFFNIAAGIAAALFIVATGAIATKVISRKILQKSITTKALLDNKLRNGEKLSNIEWWKYRFANKRINLANAINGPLRDDGPSTILGCLSENSSEAVEGAIEDVSDLIR